MGSVQLFIEKNFKKRTPKQVAPTVVNT